MKIGFSIVFVTFVIIGHNFSIAQLITKPTVNPASAIQVRTDLKSDPRLEQVVPEFKITVNTWSAGKISASQAVISYSIRIDDITQPMEHGICWNISTNPTISNQKTIAKGYTTNTLYGEMNGLKPGTKYYVKSYMKLLNYPDKIYYGNEINFPTLQGTTK